MFRRFLQKYGLPLGIVLVFLGTIFLVKCDIDNAKRDALGRPDIPGVSPTQP